jgi:hypothetical protein
VLQELAEDYERAAEVEAPQLARLTNPRAVVTDVYAEQRFRRASGEYRSTFYKAHNGFEVSEKRRKAEEKEARKNADCAASRGSDENDDPAACAGRAATSEAAPGAVAAPGEPNLGNPDDAAIEVDAPVAPEGAEVGSQNGPSFGADDTVGNAAGDAVMADAARTSGQDTPMRRSFHRIPGRRRKRSGRGNRGVRRSTPLGDGESAVAAQRPAPGLRPRLPEGRVGGSGATTLTRPSANLSRGETVRVGPETSAYGDGGATGGRHPP